MAPLVQNLQRLYRTGQILPSGEGCIGKGLCLQPEQQACFQSYPSIDTHNLKIFELNLQLLIKTYSASPFSISSCEFLLTLETCRSFKRNLGLDLAGIIKHARIGTMEIFCSYNGIFLSWPTGQYLQKNPTYGGNKQTKDRRILPFID